MKKRFFIVVVIGFLTGAALTLSMHFRGKEESADEYFE